MYRETRTFNSMRNISVGIANQVLITLLNFISRTIFIKTLGVEYLGINGLFNNILTVLSLAELGIGNAIMYALYRPLSLEDKSKVAAIMQYYRKLYHIVAGVVTVAGLLLVPFLPLLVNTERIVANITIYYVLYLCNTVFSYLFSYRASIVNADQKMYITKIYYFAFYVVQFILQSILLVVTHNFLYYLAAQILCTLGNNYFISKKAVKLYPYITYKDILDKNERRVIFDNIKSLFLYKLGGVLLNNSTNIMISIMIGTVWVGYYSNYGMFITALLLFVNIIFSSVNASIGNLNISADTEHKCSIFNVLNFIAFWISGFASITLFILFNDFIAVWIGREYILDRLTVGAIILNFYILGIINPVWIFRDSVGLFNHTKYVFMITSALNIILSVLLGKLAGLGGILISAPVARLVTNFWYEPLILYRIFFKKNSTEYFKKQLKYFILTIISGAAAYILTEWISVITLGGFIVKILVCGLIPNVLFYVLLRKTTEFIYIKRNYIDKIVKYVCKLRLN